MAPEGELRPLAVLRTVAGTAVLLLGAAYLFGALTKATQILGAGQVVTDTLPLVPLEQLLVLGIIQSIPVVVVTVLLLFAVLIWNEYAERRAARPFQMSLSEIKKPRPRRTSDRVRWALILFSAAGTVGWAYYCLASPPTAFLVTGLALLIAWWRKPPEIPVWRWIVVVVTTWLVATLALSYLDPASMPRANLQLRDGKAIEGDLLVATSATYVVGTGDRKFMSVPVGEIRDVDLESPEDNSSTTSEILFGVKLP